MRDPTTAEKRKFQTACKALRELCDVGFNLYLADGDMHLMTGDSHSPDRRGRAQQENSADSAFLGNAGGGGW